MMNEIAVVEQLPIITEKLKKVGEELDKRINELHLDSLVCNEETRKEIKNLRTQLGTEFKECENQRKTIKNQVMTPYEEFNKIYEEEIKTRYQQADLILKTKIDEVENGIKEKTKELALEYFNEYKASKTVIKDNYLTFDELNLSIGLDGLTDKGALVKKYKDAIIEKVDNVERDIETINTMEHNSEILVEYLKNKNLSLAIKEVNDRYVILNQVQKDYEIVQEEQKQEEKVVEKVEEVLSAPNEEEKLYTIKFKATSTRENLSFLVKVMKERGIEYEQFK
ncbi:MAG: hypothetical protein MR550_05435 [Bacilli bacterium]|nr:hypothetical protein [Bacilli bacterium]